MRDLHLIVGALLIGWLLMKFAHFGLIEVLILYTAVFAAITYWRRTRVAAQKK